MSSQICDFATSAAPDTFLYATSFFLFGLGVKVLCLMVISMILGWQRYKIRQEIFVKFVPTLLLLAKELCTPPPAPVRMETPASMPPFNPADYSMRYMPGISAINVRMNTEIETEEEDDTRSATTSNNNESDNE